MKFAWFLILHMLKGLVGFILLPFALVLLPFVWLALYVLELYEQFESKERQ